MTLKVILLMVLSLQSFRRIKGQVSPWQEPFVALTSEAVNKGIEYKKSGTTRLDLTIPEFEWIGNNFELGTFNFDGSKDYLKDVKEGLFFKLILLNSWATKFTEDVLS